MEWCRGARGLIGSGRRAAGGRVGQAPIGGAHLALLAVMAVAVTIDVMKPTTLAFVVPGMAEEYGLKSPLNPQGQVPVALFPLCALVGMVLGSAGWGWLGDRIGRRASILLAGVMFIATSVCGAMPAFGWNLLMCFLMGAAVGGMLPIAFALLAETIPARHLQLADGADRRRRGGGIHRHQPACLHAGATVRLAGPVADRAADGCAPHPAQPLDPRVAAVPARRRPRRRGGA